MTTVPSATAPMIMSASATAPTAVAGASSSRTMRACWNKFKWPWMIVDLIFYASCIGITVWMQLSVVDRLGHVSCTDTGLQHQSSGDTISLEAVLIICVILPAILIFVLELIDTVSHPDRGCTRRLVHAVKETGPVVWDLFVGMVQAYLVMEVLKVWTAEPRPHFWDTCGTGTRERMCGQQAVSVYVDLKNCSSYKDENETIDWRDLTDAAKSFPSGHSCFSVFIAVFLPAHLRHRLSSNGLGCRSVFRKWLSLPWLVFATVVCFSRISDNRHHWWDVLAGAILGALAAIYTRVVISGYLRASSTGRSNSVDQLSKNGAAVASGENEV